MRRLNLVSCVRAALEVKGISTVKVVNAVNAALGQLDKDSSIQKLGASSITKKSYKVANTITEKYSGVISEPLLFDAWHYKLEAANKIAEITEIKLPECFTTWLDKMKESEVTVPA